jgi:hypothetical protein
MLAADGEPQVAPKPQVVLQDREAVIEAAAKGLPVDRWLTDQEFSDRYMALMQAYRDGIIDEQLKDEGLKFLLDHWQHEKTGTKVV